MSVPFWCVVGARVYALWQITESGETGRLEARFPEGAYIHANAGEAGTVEHVEDDTCTVRFDRTGTATVVDPRHEITRGVK